MTPVKGGGWIVDDDRANAVRFIFECADGGLTVQEIANVLNDKGTSAFTSKRKGAKWDRDKIKNLLVNKATYGESGGATKYPAVISKALFDSIQETRKIHRGGRTNESENVYKHGVLFAGLLFCGECLAPLRFRKTAARSYVACPNGCLKKLKLKLNYWTLQLLILDYLGGSVVHLDIPPVKLNKRKGQDKENERNKYNRLRLAGLMRLDIKQINITPGYEDNDFVNIVWRNPKRKDSEFLLP